MIFLKNIKNNIDFFLRQIINFSRKNYSEQNEAKEGLFAKRKAQKRENILFEKYNLNHLKNNSTRQNYLENLYTIDVLDKYLTITSKEYLKIIDIGCKNWFYVKGEYFFFKKYSSQFTLNGIELDSKRLYTNFYTRAEVAKFHIKNLQNTNYIEDDLLKHNEKYDYIIWFLPFVAKEPLLSWGLPIKYFQPEKMLNHSYTLLEDNGKIFIINQGEVEYNLQKDLCEKLNIKYTPLGEIKSDFEIFEQHKRYGIIIKN